MSGLRAARTAIDSLIADAELGHVDAAVTEDDCIDLAARVAALRLAVRRRRTIAASPFRLLDEVHLDTERRAIRLVTDKVDLDDAFALALTCSVLRESVLPPAQAKQQPALLSHSGQGDPVR